MSQYSMGGCTVLVRNAGSEQVAEVEVCGDLDLEARPMLAEVTDYLVGLAVPQVIMELRHLEFAGSVLPNWLLGIQHRLCDGTSVSVRHPAPLVRWILTVTDLADLIENRSNGRTSV